MKLNPTESRVLQILIESTVASVSASCDRASGVHDKAIARLRIKRGFMKETGQEVPGKLNIIDLDFLESNFRQWFGNKLYYVVIIDNLVDIPFII